MHTNLLLEIAEPIFSFVFDFRASCIENGYGFTIYKASALRRFSHFEAQGFEHQISFQLIREAKYALSAFVDEMVMTADWGQRMEWAKKTLQMEFFGEHLAGVGFYEHLNELKCNPSLHIDVLEIYYYCLHLGFRGQYQNQVDQLKTALLGLNVLIQGQRGIPSAKLTPHAINSMTLLRKRTRRVSFWGWIGIILLAQGLIYHGYYYAAHHQTDVVFKQLSSGLGKGQAR